MKTAAIVVTSILLGAAPAAGDAAAQSKAEGLPPNARIQSGINLYLELHNILLVASGAAEGGEPEYLTQINAYRQARELVADPRVWRLVNDALVEGPDIAAITGRAERLPPDLAAADREGAVKILRALGEAWPRFEVKDRVDRNRSLQNILVKVLRRQFSQAIEPRVMPALYSTMKFAPLDAPITVYPVINAVEIGAWGKTGKGYYLVIPVARRTALTTIESLVHELTHIIDGNQPPGTISVLAKMREKGAAADPQALASMIHGLVAWNAGDLIRRFVKQDYVPLTQAPALQAQIAAYLPSYDGPWAAYLDGRISADAAVEAMVAGLRPGPRSD